MPGGEQVLDGETSADLVLEEHGVGRQAHRRAVEEHHGHPMFDLPLEELVILAGAGDQQPVDPSSDEAVDDLALAARIVVGAHGDQQVTFGEGGILDEPGDRRVERVRHVGDDEADRRRPGRPPQRAGPVVAAVAERAHRRLHPGIDLIADERLLVDDAGDRLDAHAGDRGDVLESRTAQVVGHRPSLGGTVMTTLSDVQCPPVLRRRFREHPPIGLRHR